MEVDDDACCGRDASGIYSFQDNTASQTTSAAILKSIAKAAYYSLQQWTAVAKLCGGSGG